MDRNFARNRFPSSRLVIGHVRSAFEALAHDLRLLRFLFEKHEIAADRKLSDPLTFQSIPSPFQEKKYYLYDPNDPMRGYDTLLGVAANGSVMWNTVDGTNGETKWLERLAL